MSSSNSRRKKSRHSSGRSLEGQPTKSLARNGIDFAAILLGFIVALIVILLIWNALSDGRGAEARLPTDRTDLVKMVVSASDDEYRKMLDSEDLDFITRVFDAVNQRGASGTARNEIKTHYRRVAASDRILNFAPPVDSELKFRASSNKLNALARAYSINERLDLKEPVEITLRSAAAALLNSNDKRIALQARLSLLAMDARNPEDDIAGVGERLYQLAVDEPTEPTVHEILLSSVNYHMSSDRRRDVGVQLIDAVLGNIQEGEFVENRELSEVFQRYADLKLIASEGYYGAWEARTFSGPVGYAQLRDVALALTTKKKGGGRLLDVVTGIARWFEQTGEYSYSTPVYQSLFDGANDFQLPSICKRAERVGRYGLKRAASVGQPMVFEGRTIDGALDPKNFSDQIVVVVFFKIGDPDSSAAIKFIEKERRTWAERPVREIAVCLDANELDQDSKKIRELAMSYKSWTFCIPDENGQVPIFDQCPSERSSRVMLVNKKGLITSVDISPSDLSAQIGFALVSDGLN